MEISYDWTDFSLKTIYSKTRIGALKTEIQIEFVFKSQGVKYSKMFSCKLMGSIGQNFEIWFCTIPQN